MREKKRQARRQGTLPPAAPIPSLTAKRGGRWGTQLSDVTEPATEVSRGQAEAS